MSSVKGKNRDKQTNQPTDFSLAFLLNVREHWEDLYIFIANSIFKNRRITMNPSSYNYSDKFK